MSFDEKLRQSFDQFADQLRDEARRRLSSLSDELGDTYENERQALAKTAEENARRTLDQEVASRVATEVAAVEARVSEAVTAAETRGVENGRKTGLEEGKQQGREEGFREGRVDGIEHLKASELERSQRLIEAIRAIDGAKSLTEVLDSLVSSAGHHARRAAILLLRNGQLKGWRFIGFGSLDEKTDVDVPASDAGVIAEAARTGSAISADSAAANAAPAFAALPPGREVLAVPVAMSGQIVAVLYADPGSNDSAGQDHHKLVWPAIVELLALHAARCLEAITALRAAKALAERPAASPAAAAGDKEDPIEAAQRYARLVISEIKLYHENAVVAGRKERDLMARLGGEIARARVLYDQRVPADVRRRHDYFEDELVKTLAGGDASLIAKR
jgi:hypothetical protein